eukprot:4949484-Amphidinium_carterae.1
MADHGFPALQGLKQLDMRGCHLDHASAKILAAVLARLRRLQHLELGDQTLLRSWVSALSEQQDVCLDSWTSLRLDGAGITEADEVFAGIQRLSTLEVLSLSGNQFGGRSGVAFESTLKALPQLRELQLSSCHLATVDLQLLSRALRQHAGRTEKLLLHGNRSLTDEDAKELAAVALPSLMWLKEVNLVDTSVTQPWARGAWSLVDLMSISLLVRRAKQWWVKVSMKSVRLASVPKSCVAVSVCKRCVVCNFLKLGLLVGVSSLKVMQRWIDGLVGVASEFAEGLLAEIEGLLLSFQQTLVNDGGTTARLLVQPLEQGVDGK